MADSAGLEPATYRLTADCSTVELRVNTFGEVYRILTDVVCLEGRSPSTLDEYPKMARIRRIELRSTDRQSVVITIIPYPHTTVGEATSQVSDHLAWLRI